MGAKNMKRLLILLLLLSAVFMSSCTALKSTDKDKTTSAAVGLAEGNIAPDFTLKNIDGSEVKLSDYRGKIVVLNFFGVWCPWCVKEMPGFINVYNDYKDKNAELLVVDVGDTKSKLLDYLKTNNFIIKPVIDDGQQVSNLYRISGYPTTYIIDGQGVTKRISRGYMDENNLRTILDSLIKG
jgi:peroxiredoxin